MTRKAVSVASLLASCALLAVAIAPVAGLVGWFGYSQSGMTGVAAAGVAAAICWVSASLALAAAFVGQQLGQPIGGILGGMLFRMGLPLLAGIALQKTSPPLSEAGVFLMILGIYLVALVVETLLSLRFVPPAFVPGGKAASVAGGVEGR